MKPLGAAAITSSSFPPFACAPSCSPAQLPRLRLRSNSCWRAELFSDMEWDEWEGAVGMQGLMPQELLQHKQQQMQQHQQELETYHMVAKEHHQPSPLPHPVNASAAECQEWEAVLLAAEAKSPAGLHFGVAKQQAVVKLSVYAVIECGSHSTRLLISDGLQDLVLVTRDTHLGAMSRQQQEQMCPSQAQEPSCSLSDKSDLRCQEIVQASRTPSNLASKGEAATLAALHEFMELLSSYQVLGMVAVATAAVRDALDAGPLLQAAQTILGCPIRVLSGAEEGQLAFKGATSSMLLPATSSVRCQSCLLFDLGGRSTEFAVGNVGFEPRLVLSVPLGCLSLQAAAADGQAGTTAGAEGPSFQPPGDVLMQCADALLAAHAEPLQHIQAAHVCQQARHGLGQFHPQEHCEDCAAAAQGTAPTEQTIAVGTGGTITTIAALLLRLQQYEHTAVHMSTLSAHDVEHLMKQLEDNSFLARSLQQYPWLTAARGSSLQSGCAAILAIMKLLKIHHVLVSDRDLLHGLMMELLTSNAVGRNPTHGLMKSSLTGRSQV